MVAENILKGLAKPISWREITSLNHNEAILLDVRTKEEYQLGTIEGAINIPLDELRNNLNKLPKDKKIIVFCGVGLRGYIASRILLQNGFSEVYNLNGGYKTYETAIQKQSNEDIFENDYIGIDDNIYKKTTSATVEKIKDIKIIDACGLQCPGPILKLKNSIEEIKEGEVIKIIATDPGFYKDVKAWASVTGNELIEINNNGKEISAVIKKRSQSLDSIKTENLGNNTTLICFSDDLDKALATFVIANGAAAMGKKVTIFFTFWGLNVIKKTEKINVKKDIFGKMFGFMLPKSSKKLKLSKMNMVGIGSKIMRFLMKKKNIESLENMIQTAVKNGVKLVACQMSMDIMGIKKEELLDNIEVGGVATYLEKASESNINLFI